MFSPKFSFNVIIFIINLNLGEKVEASLYFFIPTYISTVY